MRNTLRRRAVALALSWAVSASSAWNADTNPPAGLVTIFGPQRFVRTTGAKDVYTTSIAAPPWVKGPYSLHVQNGEANGAYRVSSAWIEVGSKQVAGPSDFNPNVATLDRPVSLAPSSSLKVTLASKPTSFLSVSVAGTSADHTPPPVTVEPGPGSVTRSATPRLVVYYRDAPGPGEPAASGLDVASLRVSVDDVDRTSLFTRRSDEASAEWPADQPLAEGPHRLGASVKDQAGNLGEAAAEFRVDLTRPVLEIAEPAAASFLPTRAPSLRLRYRDETGLDLESLQVLVDGVERTSLFARGPTEARAVLDAGTALAEGPNQLSARIWDLGGNEAVAAISFNVDVRPPRLAITQPLAGARLGASEVEAIVQYSDDQALAVESFQAAIDGRPVTFGAGSEGAMGRMLLGDGSHELAVTIRDQAGNASATVSTFAVDTTLPTLRIVQPFPGAMLGTATPRIVVEYADAQGIDMAQFRFSVNGVDRTRLFEVEPDGAAATLGEGSRLPEGEATLVAEVRDLTGNLARATATFTVDTIAPTGSVEEPARFSRSGAPLVRVRYADAGTSVVTASVHIAVDGIDRTSLFAVGATGATGIIGDLPLADGGHQVAVTLSDQAGNEGHFSGSFTVDSLPPRGAFAEPPTFVGDRTPSLRLTYGDGAGSGVEPSSVRIFLSKGEEPEVDVTSYFAVEPDEAIGVVPVGSPLLDGPYHLRAMFADLAQNPGLARASFEVDTVAPSFDVESPARGAFVATVTPSIVVRYRDERSGVDPDGIVVLVDSVDRTARLARDGSHAEGMLAPGDALAQGAHAMHVTVVDRAGNTATVPDHRFVVDTVSPTIAVEQPPADGYLGASPALLRARYTDAQAGAGNGVDPASVRLLVDGVDRTSEFTVAAASAQAILALADGSHSLAVDVLDWAGNAASAAGAFAVDTQPPAVSVVSPEEGSYLNHPDEAGRATFSGHVEDVDPNLTLQCRRGETVVTGAVEGGQFTCAVPLAEGGNSVELILTDRSGHQTILTRTVTVDRTAPQITLLSPAAGEYTAAAALDVSGGVVDASPVTVHVEGVTAEVGGSRFVARGVPVGEGAEVTLRATAEDAAGNVVETSVVVRVDREAPVVRITGPSPGAFLRGGTVEVSGTVEDAAPVLVDVNGVSTFVSGAGSPGLRPFTIGVPVMEGLSSLLATARDAAGNVGTHQIEVRVDSMAPVIALAEPGDGSITNRYSIRLAGTVSDASSVTLRLGEAVVSLVSGAFALDVPLALEGANVLVLTATDSAGNAGRLEVAVVRDTAPPQLEIVVPAAGAALGNLPVFVQGLVRDATATAVTVDGAPATRIGEAWEAQLASLPEGPHTFSVRATDAAGNETTAAREITLDFAPPVVSIALPASGAITAAAAISVSGVVDDRSAVTVSVNGVRAMVAGTGPFAFTAAAVPLAEGDNLLRAVATDAAGRPGEAELVVTRDSIPPVIEVAAPESLSRRWSGDAVAVATDNLGLAHVALRAAVSSRDACTAGAISFEAPPYRLPITVPACASTGDTLMVVAEAVDRAGNVATATRGVRVTSDGVVTGQVLSDATSLPLSGVTVRAVSGSGAGVVATTDEKGRYSLPVRDVDAVVVAEQPGMTSVERELVVASGVGTVPVDARLTPVGPALTIGPDGGVLGHWSAGPVAVTITAPAGALAAETGFTLTPLSPQGLPALLPLGWSPLAAFDLRTVSPLAAPLTAALTGLPGLAVHLVTYQPSTHGWFMVAPGLIASDGALTVGLRGPGAYAIVVPDADDPPVAVPPADEALTGVEMVPVPPTATSTGATDPATVPPGGGTARGKLVVQSPVALPSGTVVQAEVMESFLLASGDVASEEKRTQDIVLFRPAGGSGSGSESLVAELPITPSRSYGTTDLVEGKVHLDILAGREWVRGHLGGSEAVVLEAGEATLGVPARALPEDTAIALESVALSAFLPSGAGLAPLAEMLVDLSGQRLALPADVSVAAGSIRPGDTILLARVERVDGTPRLVVVATGEVVGDRIVSRASGNLPGVREGGRYVFYRTAPVGFVAGVTSSTAGPVKAVVQTVGLPFIALSRADGRYLIPAVAGSQVTVSALVPGTSLRGSGAADVSVGEPTSLSLLLAGQVTTATISPSDGAQDLPTSVPIAITSVAALNPSSATTANVKLYRGSSSSDPEVPIRLVLSGSGRLLSIVPQTALAFSTWYTLQASGVRGVLGEAVVVPSSTFRTKADTPPIHDPNALTFSFPDSDGNVTIKAPTGSFPPGAQILILNSGSADVATFTVDNDGAVGVLVPATIRASLNDLLLVTITDPQGNTTTFNRSKFSDPATGRTAIGPGGGVVEGPGGVELRIPDGALEKGAVFRLEAFTPLADEPQPNLGTDDGGQVPGHFGAGIRIESPDKPVFKKEVKLAFPLPDFNDVPEDQRPDKPENAFYYVHRRIDGPDGAPAAYEILDHAFVEGTGVNAKVMMASPPFSGYVNSLGLLDPTGSIAASAVNVVYLMWTYDRLLPAVPQPAAVVGKALRTKWDPQAVEPEYLPVEGALVTAVDEMGNPLSGTKTIARSQADGRFMLLEGQYRGGSVRLKFEHAGEVRFATAYPVARTEWVRYDWGIFEPTLKLYRVVATANITFPAEEPPPPPPVIQIRVMKRLADGSRQDTNGLVVAGTPLVIGFTSSKDLTVRSVSIQGISYNARGPLVGDPSGFAHVLDDPTSADGSYTPAQPGTYTVVATALSPFGGSATQSSTFRVIASGGSQRDPLPDEPPRIITAQTVPRDDARGVPATAFLQVTFSEPVTTVSSNVTLAEVLVNGQPGEVVPTRLSGVGREGQPLDTINAGDAITSLTIEPLTGLKFGRRYRLTLTDGIVDLDTPTPKKLASCKVDSNGNPVFMAPVACETSFETFGPQAVGGSGDFGSPGIVVRQNRSYLVQSYFYGGTLKVFDVTDPVAPVETEASGRYSVTGMPVDIAGEGTNLVVATGPSSRGPVPSNLYLYDVSEGQVQWVGATSVTSSTLKGTIARVTVKGDFAYTATTNQGIQVVDLNQARAVFTPDPPASYWDMIRALNTDEQGFGQEAVVSTIEVRKDDGSRVRLADLKVGDYEVDGSVQPVVLATGELPLVIANPQASSVTWKGPLSLSGSSLSFGQAVALARVRDSDLALVGGHGTTPSGSGLLLMVVSLADMANPRVVSSVDLSREACLTGMHDIAVKDKLALVGAPGCVGLVNIADPAAPFLAGSLTGVGGRLALGTGQQDGILFNTAYSPFGGQSPLGGVRVATFGPMVLLLDKDKKVLPRIKLPKNTDTFVRALVPAAGDTVEGVEVSIIEKDGKVRKQTGSIPTQKTLTLTRDPETGQYLAPLKIVDKDCGLKLNESGDEATTPCVGDLESGPWTRLDVKLPPAYGSLEMTSDIRAFRIANLGDSITHGVQEGIVVQEDQVNSYPAQFARQVDKLLGSKDKGYNQQQTIFTQALIEDPGSPPIPPLGRVYDAAGDGSRLNPQVHPVNNLGLSGAQTADIYTAKVGDYPLVDDDGSLVCYEDGSYCNPKASRHVWPLVLGRQAGTVGATPIPDDGTAVEAAGKLDPTLLIAYVGGNDVLGAARNCDLNAITDPAVFRRNYETLVEKILATGTRAEIVIATVPDVDTVPHMIPVGEKIGDLPFTVPLSFFKRLVGTLVGVSEEKATHALETAVLDSNDPEGGVYLRGTLTSLSVLSREQVIDRADKRHFLPTKFHLKSKGEKKDVLTPDKLEQIRQTVVQYNQIIRDIAQKHGFAVAEVNALLHDRVTNATAPTRLNGLRTGTLRDQPGDDGIQRGIGNSLFCWDGIHPNGAGYSLMANEFIKVINARLGEGDFGGLSKGDQIPLITGASAGGSEDQINPLLMRYLTLKRTRIQSEVNGVE